MKTFTKAFAFALFSLPLLASAGNRVATSSMQVSFVVTESCAVQSAPASTTPANPATAAKSPAVNCQLHTPYLITRGNEKAATAASSSDNSMSIRQETGTQDWTIYF